MGSLDEYFDEFRRRIQVKSSITNVGDDPVFYMIVPPDKMIDVKLKIPAWKARLKKDGWEVKTLSLAKLVNSILQKYDLRNVWIESESDDIFNFVDINSSLANVLNGENTLLINRIKDYFKEIDSNSKSIVIITDVESLHPYLRVGAIEQNLNGCFTAPTLILYPGTREGNMLRFLGVYPLDGNYRSTHIGD